MNEEIVTRTVYRKNATHDHYYRYYDENGYVASADEIYCQPVNGDKRNQNDPKETDMQLNGTAFRCCFCYFQSESVAMWHMYAPLGSCLRYTKGIIENCADAIANATIKRKSKGKDVVLAPSDLTFIPQEVIYYDEYDGVFKFGRSKHYAEGNYSDFEELKKLAPTKTLHWAYETEIRLYVIIKDDTLRRNKVKPSSIEALILNLQPHRARHIKKYQSPFYIGGNEAKLAADKSDLEGKAFIDIAEETRKNQKHIRRLRRERLMKSVNSPH